jgi:HK97 family phage major capsid protein
VPTLPQLVEQLAAARSRAERDIATATDRVRQITEQARADGRDRLSRSEDEAADMWLQERDKARAELRDLDRKIREVDKVYDDEKAIDAAMRDVRSTEISSRPAYDRVARIGAEIGQPDGPRWVRRHDRRPAVVARGQRFADHEIVAEHAAARADQDAHVVGHHGGLGSMIRAMTTTSGSAVVPTVWAGDIIDRARNLSAVLRAGAEITPMDAKTVQIGRLTTDPTAAFRAEGSTITAADPVFDNVTLDAKTMSALVVGSLEWFQDAPNVDDVVTAAIAAAIAAELDLNALMGGVIAGGEVGATGYNRTFPTPPAPRGVLATLLAVAASSVLGSGANGTAQTATSFWREVQQTVFLPQSFNEAPNALLWNAKLNQQYIDAYDTTNQPLRMPENIAAMDRFVTNQIESFTQGTMTNVATDLFAGDWTQLLIGQRLDLIVQTLTERYAENGQIGIVAHWRGDVGLARPRAFAVYRYLQGAV